MGRGNVPQAVEPGGARLKGQDRQIVELRRRGRGAFTYW